MRMTIEEIRNTLRERGWTQKRLADMLHVHQVTLGLILTGKNKLTPQLEAHIEQLFSRRKEPHIDLELSLPNAVVERWVPDFAQLAPEQRKAAVEAVLREAAQKLIREGERQFSQQEPAGIRDFCTTLQPAPAPCGE